MRLNAYSIFDTASGLYDRPNFINSDAQAIRMFGDICMDEKHPIGQHPEDYSMFALVLGMIIVVSWCRVRRVIWLLVLRWLLLVELVMRLR